MGHAGERAELRRLTWERVPARVPQAAPRGAWIANTKDRLRDIGEVRFLCDEAVASESEAESAPVVVEAPKKLWWMIGGWAMALVLGAVAAYALWPRTADLKPLVRFSVDLGPDAVAGARTTVVLSPDGRRIAYLVKGGLATRTLDQLSVTVLTGTEGASDPFFSPDGQWIGFSTLAGGTIKKISVQGGAAVPLGPGGLLRGASWSEDGAIFAALGTANPSRAFPKREARLKC